MDTLGGVNLEEERSRLNDTFHLQLNGKTGLSSDYNNTHAWFNLRFELLESRDTPTLNSEIQRFAEKLQQFSYYEEWNLFTVKAKDKLTDTDKYILFGEPSVKKLIQEINNIVDELKAIGREISSEQILDFEKFQSYYKDAILKRTKKIMSLISGDNITNRIVDRIETIL